MCRSQSAVSASWGQIDALLGVKHTSCLKVCGFELQRQALSMFLTRLIYKVQISILWNNGGNCAIQIIKQNPSNTCNLRRSAVHDDSASIMIEHYAANWYQEGLKHYLLWFVCFPHYKKAWEFSEVVLAKYSWPQVIWRFITLLQMLCVLYNQDVFHWIVIKAKTCFTEELDGIWDDHSRFRCVKQK